jgi:hypothetical protein
MSKQKRTVIPQAHVDNLYKKIAKQACKISELEKELEFFYEESMNLLALKVNK